MRGVPALCVRLAAAAAALSLCWAAAAASTPVVWEHSARLAPGPPRVEGRAEGVAIDEEGTLSLSLPLREIFPGGSEAAPPPLIWNGVIDPSGEIHLGTGNVAGVITIDRKGTAASGFEMDNLGIRAMALGSQGALFIGTFPNGDIYRVPRGKDPEAWVEMDDRYIWSMTVDAGQRLYVGTGERGIVYRVPSRGEKEIVFDSDQSHISSLALDRSGALLAGTDPDGLLYRVKEDGATELLLDTDLREVSALAIGRDGSIYAAAVSQETPPAPRKPGEKSDLMIEVTPAPDGSILEDPEEAPRKISIDLAELLPAAQRGDLGTMGRIYRLDEGKAPLLVWKSDIERVHALAVARDGAILFGTGGSGAGRIYRLDAEGSATMLHQVREPQVTALMAAPDGRVMACTSNPGRVYALDATALSSGSYFSEVYDAGRPAQWGAIAWDADIPAGARVEIATRSGNRPVPDSTWSDWSSPYASERGTPVSSPQARYLQWRAELSRLKNDVMPSLHRVKVTLLPQNQGPTVRGLAVLAAGEKTPPASAVPPTSAVPPASAVRGEGAPKALGPPAGSRWVTWEAVDGDDDTLAQTILLKKDGESEFKPVAENASSPFALSESGLAEGTYTLRVEVTDKPINGPERALKDAATSHRFVVDRTPPRLEPKRSAQTPPAGRYLFEVQAMDASSPIARAEYTLEDRDDAAWLPLSCRDGICDTPAEGFLLDLAQSAVQGKLRLRVVDAAGNSAVLDAPAAGSR